MMATDPMALVIAIFFVASFFCQVGTSPTDLESQFGFKKTISQQKRSVFSFPPDSILQITVGIATAEKFDENNAGVVLAFQQNVKLPTESHPNSLVFPTSATRHFSIYNYLKSMLSRYGFNGAECLKKMICQKTKSSLNGTLLEEIGEFILSPWKHRGLILNKDKHDLYFDPEVLGKEGKNCSSSFPQCSETPLEKISFLTHFLLKK